MTSGRLRHLGGRALGDELRRSRGRRCARRAAPRTRRRARRAGSPCRARCRTCSSTVAISSVSRGRAPTTARRGTAASGSHTSARASSTTRRCRGSATGGTVGVVGEADQLEHASQRSRSSAVGRERPVRSRHRLAPPRWARSATSRWSRTVRPPNSSMRWNVRARPSRARWYGASPARSCPSSRTCPEFGRSTPDRQLNRVVLPAPFGPMSATSSPGRASPTRRPARRCPRTACRRCSATSTGRPAVACGVAAAMVIGSPPADDGHVGFVRRHGRSPGARRGLLAAA